MIVEKYQPYIENMLRAEPWREGKGSAVRCDSHIEWDGTRFWLCKSCGRIGTSLVQLHARVITPKQLLRDAFQGIGERLIKLQEARR